MKQGQLLQDCTGDKWFYKNFKQDFREKLLQTASWIPDGLEKVSDHFQMASHDYMRRRRM